MRQRLSGPIVRIGSNDECSWSYGEESGDFRHYVRTLHTLVSVDDELASLDVVDDASARKVFVFVIRHGLRNGLFGKRCCVELLPFTPDVVMPTRVG